MLTAPLISICVSILTSANTPNIGRSPPNTYSREEILGNISYYLRFQAVDADIEALIQSSYKAVDGDEIAAKCHSPNQSYDHFNPPQ